MERKVIQTNATDIKCWNCSTEAKLIWFESLEVWMCKKCAEIAYAEKNRFIRRLTNKKPRCVTIDGFINRHNLERFKDELPNKER